MALGFGDGVLHGVYNIYSSWIVKCFCVDKVATIAVSASELIARLMTW